MDQQLRSSDTLDLARVARLVRPFETLEPRAVRRAGGGWSIGYGHVRSARAGAEVTAAEAEALLLYDLGRVAAVVQSAVYAPVHRNQLEALVAFAFHIGVENFLRSTTLHRINAGDSLGAAQELERWCRADLGGEFQVVDALVRRRAAEKAHFLTPPEGFPKASRARLRPQFEGSPISTEDDPDAAPSAALTAADKISARLRALVPDGADAGELQPSNAEPEPAPLPEPPRASSVAPADIQTRVGPEVAQPAPGRLDSDAAVIAEAGAAPMLLEMFGRREPEIPPPPMPFEVETALARAPAPPAPPAAPAAAPPARREAARRDVWPAISPAATGPGDPFSLDPNQTEWIDAPSREESPPPLSLDRTAPRRRGQGASASQPTETARPRRALWTMVPRTWLWVGFVLGLAGFGWSIWSIFKTDPGWVNFIAGLAAIAVMAICAYVLSGSANRRQ